MGSECEGVQGLLDYKVTPKKGVWWVDVKFNIHRKRVWWADVKFHVHRKGVWCGR